MTEYLKWAEKQSETITAKKAENFYNTGFVLTRKPKYTFQQTQSLRINLCDFENSSENRRILRKNEGLKIIKAQIPYLEYKWQIGKLAKDFYDQKFGQKIFSANKVKEILTGDGAFNTLLIYKKDNVVIGYTICFETDKIIHYSYPFYNLGTDRDTGLGMMLLAINNAHNQGKEFIYLGSYQRLTDSYKLQFKGLEFFEKDTGWKKYPDFKPKI